MRTNRLILLLLLFLLTLNAQVLAAPIPVVLNNQPVVFSVEPSVENERVLVQMRPIFEAFGASLEWDGPTQTVTATKDDTTITLTIDSATAYIDRFPTTLDVPARAIQGCTMVPLRFISEALGASVDYENGVVTILPGLQEEGSPTTPKTAQIGELIDFGKTQIKINSVSYCDEWDYVQAAPGERLALINADFYVGDKPVTDLYWYSTNFLVGAKTQQGYEIQAVAGALINLTVGETCTDTLCYRVFSNDSISKITVLNPLDSTYSQRYVVKF